MQQPQIPLEQPAFSHPPNGGKVALQYGLILGGVIGIIDILYSYLLDNGSITWFNGILESVYRLPSLFLATAISGIIVSIPIYLLCSLPSSWLVSLRPGDQNG